MQNVYSLTSQKVLEIDKTKSNFLSKAVDFNDFKSLSNKHSIIYEDIFFVEQLLELYKDDYFYIKFIWMFIDPKSNRELYYKTLSNLIELVPNNDKKEKVILQRMMPEGYYFFTVDDDPEAFKYFLESFNTKASTSSLTNIENDTDQVNNVEKIDYTQEQIKGFVEKIRLLK